MGALQLSVQTGDMTRLETIRLDNGDISHDTNTIKVLEYHRLCVKIVKEKDLWKFMRALFAD
jgi:hypothetical protein